MGWGRRLPRVKSLGQGSELVLSWQGTKVVDAMDRAALDALDEVADAAREFWAEEEWVLEHHPYMTGTEMRAGRFNAFVSGDHVAEMVGTVILDEDYPMYEEYGTGTRLGHFPLRNTMDHAAPLVRTFLARAARQRLADIKAGR